jgi:hypothetical protein
MRRMIGGLRFSYCLECPKRRVRANHRRLKKK